jgi:beta-lactam-binding protein with PASTA domain
MDRSDEMPRVPVVRGRSVESASMAVRQAGLEPAAPPERFADGKARVEGSYPPSGAKVEPGTRVELLPEYFDLSEVVANVFPGWLVHDVIGMDSGSAATTLHESGFQTLFLNGFDDNIAADLVCATHPRGGVYVPVGGIVVTVTVSTGPYPPPDPPEPPTVPKTLPG